MRKDDKHEPVQDKNDSVFVIERTQNFFLSAQKLNDFIRNLPLERSDNDQLIELLVEHIQQAEKDAFSSGFRFGVVCGGCGLHPRTRQTAIDEITVC